MIASRYEGAPPLARLIIDRCHGITPSALAAFDDLELRLVRLIALRASVAAVGPENVGENLVGKVLAEADAALDAFITLVLTEGALDAMREGLEVCDG